MALLQISEPGGKPAAPKHRLAVGIDLGTTNSLVAASCGQKVEILPDDEGNYLMPSIVSYGTNSAPVVGHAALPAAVEDPANTIISVKRLLGRSLGEVSDDEQFGQYQFASTGVDSAPVLQTAAGDKNPVQVSADILSALAQRAERALKGKLEGVVITVPAYFNDAQRQQTKDAAQLAGLQVLRLLNEPTAAAVAYGLDSKDEGNVIVFDLGGGTFDVSLLSLQKGIFEVLATGGNTSLGGDDFDRALMALVRSKLGATEELNHKQTAQLKRLVIQAKHELSNSSSSELIFNDQTVRLTVEDFSAAVQDLVRQTITACRRVLRDAELDKDQIDNIVMVGGATRMPVIRQAVAEFFGKEPLTSIDPDKVVAIGAGIQADVLIGNKSADSFLLLDVNPLSLGIETMGELVEKIIPRNTTIPVARAQEFTTFKDGQTVMALHVVQGERELVKDCRSLARFELRGIPPMVAGAAKIRVTFQVDADGLLSVLAEELSTGTRAEIQVKPSYGLGSGEIEEMLQASQAHAQEDMQVRALREAQIEAQQLIDAIRAAETQDGDLLEEEERAQLDAAVAKLERAIADANKNDISEQTEALNKLSGEFAARRMDLHIAKALSGENIDSVESTND